MPTVKKSDELHRLTGTKSQAKPEPEYSLPAGTPRAPKTLSLEARKTFKRLCALLAERRALTDGDGELLRLYAITFDRHARAMAKIEDQGEICSYTRLDSNGQPHEMEKENLWLKVAVTAEKNMVAILDRLGLTPHNRGKVKPTKEPESVKPDEFGEFLARKSAAGWVMPPASDEVKKNVSQNDFEA
ncbi:MAG TPA: P27 family phage terminase small subunit [Candidatus Angelobacter sp.]|jgi:P27 family predicted phage terminase small subunit